MATPETAGDETQTPAAILRAKARQHINRGRKLSRGKAHAEAVAEFEAALRITPDSATAACEAGYAEYQLGHLAKAQRHLEHGATLLLTPNKQAACEFNLGLVAEARSQNERALRHFRRSLELRSTKQARAKIAALAPDGQCLPPLRLLKPNQDFYGLPDDYVTDVEPGPLTFVDSFSDAASVSEGKRLRVANIAYGESKQRYDLVLEEEEGLWLLATVGWDIETDFSQKTDAVRFQHVDLVPGGTAEVIVTATRTVNESGSFARETECEEKYGPASDKAMECFEAELPDRVDTEYYACGQLGERWACASAGSVKPNTETEFSALFQCR